MNRYGLKEKMDTEKMASILGVIILFADCVFFFIFMYYQLPYGDDLLSPFKDSYYYYFDNVEWHPEVRIINLKMMIEETVNRYFMFSGRVTSQFLRPLMGIGGQLCVSLISAGLYTSIIFLIAKIIYKENVFSHPLMLLFISVYQYGFTANSDYACMWIMVCNYGVTILLCLTYYYFSIKYLHRENNSFYVIIGMMVLGFFTGMTHELIVLCNIIFIFLSSLQLYMEKKYNCKKITIHIGIIIGYMVCFFAPGNRVRAGNSHDIRRFNTSIVTKIVTSIKSHLKVLGVGDDLWYTSILLFLIIGVFIICIKKEGILKFVTTKIDLLCVLGASIVGWAIAAPPVPRYGLGFFKAVFLILVGKCLLTLQIKKRLLNLIVSSCIFVLLLIYNVWWCSDLIEVTSLRRMQMNEAKVKGESEVLVELYPESTRNTMTEDNIANEIETYMNEEAEAFYGILIIPNENASQ